MPFFSSTTDLIWLGSCSPDECSHVAANGSSTLRLIIMRLWQQRLCNALIWLYVPYTISPRRSTCPISILGLYVHPSFCEASSREKESVVCLWSLILNNSNAQKGMKNRLCLPSIVPRLPTATAHSFQSSGTPAGAGEALSLKQFWKFDMKMFAPPNGRRDGERNGRQQARQRRNGKLVMPLLDSIPFEWPKLKKNHDHVRWSNQRARTDADWPTRYCTSQSRCRAMSP